VKWRDFRGDKGTRLERLIAIIFPESEDWRALYGDGTPWVISLPSL